MTTTMEQQGIRVLLRVMLLIGDHHYALGDAEIACETSALRQYLSTPDPQVSADATQRTSYAQPPIPLPLKLRERIADLCQRLGVTEPFYDQLSEQEATPLLERLQAEEDELMQVAEKALTPCPPSATTPLIEKALIRQLKQRWRTRFRPAGEVDAVRGLWEAFKTRVCGEAVPDQAMRAGQYEQLLAALADPGTKRKE